MRVVSLIFLYLLSSCQPLFGEPATKKSTDPPPPQEQVTPGHETFSTKTPPDYESLVKAYERERLTLVKEHKEDAKKIVFFEKQLLQRFESLSQRWMGTRWALGVPQAVEPGPGKINCGTFVGRILNDAGFKVDVKHLQRQPAQLIIQSFVGGKRIRKFSKASMKKFLNSVREMGPGLYIIGLDFHVGFLLQNEDGEIAFIHSSYETNKVRNEPAATAQPIVTSNYRVVGKILSDKNIRDWMKGKKIKVKGKW